MIMFASYHMFSFTNFNIDEVQKYRMGYSMISFLGLTFMVNVGMMIVKNVKRWKLKKAWEKKRLYY